MPRVETFLPSQRLRPSHDAGFTQEFLNLLEAVGSLRFEKSSDEHCSIYSHLTFGQRMPCLLGCLSSQKKNSQ